MQGISSTMGSSIADLSKRQSLPEGFQQSGLISNSEVENKASIRSPVDASTINNQKIEDDEAERLLDTLNQQLETAKLGVRFKSDKESGRLVFSIYDVSTNEVVRQIPNEEVLRTSQKLKEFLERSSTEPNAAKSIGMILDKEA